MTGTIRMRLIAGVGLALLAGPWSPARAMDTVHVGRYSLTAVITSGNARLALDNEVMQRFCRDQDGCAVTLKCEYGDYVTVVSTHLVLSESVARKWAETPGGATKTDHDAVNDILLQIDFFDFSGWAWVYDADLSGGDDEDGFSIFLTRSQGLATCIAVVED